MALVLLTAAAIAFLSGTPSRADDHKHSRAAFISEILDAKPAPVTPKFRDAPDSYHVF